MNEINLDRDFYEILDDLRENEYDYQSLFRAFQVETTGRNRREVVIALMRVYSDNKDLDPKRIFARAKAIETRRRRKIVMNACKSAPMWAMVEIKKHYPDYTDEMLTDDLAHIGKRKAKPSKKRHNCFRYDQLWKLAHELNITDPNSKQYNWLCCRFAWHTQNFKKPIYITARRGRKEITFDFPPNTSERAIKAFAKFALDPSVSVDRLWEVSLEIMKDKDWR